jgi:ectoine hydroxylase-related dioxygenase (phytanoyl-CoA dioxygenase family)
MVADRAQACPLRGGDLISWDSRTTHANSANVSDKARIVAYIAAGPAVPSVPELVAYRNNAFLTGMGLNVREALMHASKKKRYTNPDALQRVRKAEQLSLLGRLLYGQDQYSELTHKASA